MCCLALIWRSNTPAQVAAHPVQRHTNVIGEPCHGSGTIQIWAVGRSVTGMAVGGDAGDGVPCRMVLGICHDGGVVWDLQWWPGQQKLQLAQQQRERSETASLPGCWADQARVPCL